ncbi:response regulator [Planctomycetota bacterium]
MARGRILIVEDDRDIVDLLEFNLQEEGYETVVAMDGAEALAQARRTQPQIIILDIMLPVLDGFEVCRSLKASEATAAIPIVILSARSQETDKVVGLELGADDYVTKPFSPRELIARIRAVLRRHKATEKDNRIEYGDLVIDPGKYQVTVAGAALSLTSTEFKLLEYLARRPGRMSSRDQIMNAVLGHDAVVSDRTVDAHIKTLRRKLDTAKDMIETVRGAGYRFKEI